MFWPQLCGNVSTLGLLEIQADTRICGHIRLAGNSSELRISGGVLARVEGGGGKVQGEAVESRIVVSGVGSRMIVDGGGEFVTQGGIHVGAGTAISLVGSSVGYCIVILCYLHARIFVCLCMLFAPRCMILGCDQERAMSKRWMCLCLH